MEGMKVEHNSVIVSLEEARTKAKDLDTQLSASLNEQAFLRTAATTAESNMHGCGT
jgi:hypothetical protein